MLGSALFTFENRIIAPARVVQVEIRRQAAEATAAMGIILDLTDEETAALARLLTNTIDADRYPLSPRIQTLKAILGKIRPEPVRGPLPPLKHYEPPRIGARRRR